MRTFFLITATLIMLYSCHSSNSKEQSIIEIVNTEKAFEKMASEHGNAEAFAFFASDSAVILRGNELIKGRNPIRSFYNNEKYSRAKVTWTPDFVDVSDCGMLGYTYGRYVWKIENGDGGFDEYKGYFHTVWEKQSDNTWKYVWD